ncbi:hypothetical protein V1523DRAFT_387076 [Lipomyces doorenjongii]
MKEGIKTAFSCIMTEYQGCVMCALARQVTPHANYDALTILNSHAIATSRFKVFDEQLSFGHAGICYGCGLNLKILNGLPEHVPGKACIYTAITRIVCYEIFMNGRLSACIKDIDRGFLDTGDIKSFGKWLNGHPLGMLVNNLTNLVYNWSTLGLVEDGVQTATGVHSIERLNMQETARAPTTLQIRRAPSLVHIEPPRPQSVHTQAWHRQVRKPGMAETWLRFLSIIQTDSDGCAICAIANRRQQHGSDDSFNQKLRAHGYLDTNDVMQFERMTYLNQSEAKTICLNCTLPRTLARSWEPHQGRTCPNPRATRVLCYIVWKNRKISHYLQGIEYANFDVNNLESFCSWLTSKSEENSEVYNMTHFVVNVMASRIRYGE